MQRYVDPLHIVWLDAHGDLHSPASSPSGNMGGMPLGWITGRFYPPGGGEVLKPVDPSNLTLYGVRDLDPIEGEFIRERGICIASSVSEVIERVAGMGSPVYLHIDLDVLDPTDNPAVSISVESGIPVQHLLELLEQLVEGKWLAGVSLASYNMNRDVDERGLRKVAYIMEKLGVIN